MDHDQAQQARHAGTLVEAIILPAGDANGWTLHFRTSDGNTVQYTGHTGSEKVYHSLDIATGVARDLGFESTRVDEEF